MSSTCVFAFVPNTPMYSLSVHPVLHLIAVGESDGTLSIIRSDNLTSPRSQSFSTGSLPVLYLEWNLFHTDELISLTADNRVVVRRFTDLITLNSEQTVLLRQDQRVLSVCWDSTSPATILLGTQLGFVDEYQVTFSGGNTSIDSEAGRTNRWFIGCRVSFVYKPIPSYIVAGCEEGIIWYISLLEANPTRSFKFPRTTYFPTPRALYRRSRGYVVVLFDSVVYVIDAIHLVEVKRFRIRPKTGPNDTDRGDNRILALDVSYTSNTDLSKLFVRTADGLAVYDLRGIIGGTVETSFWLNTTTLADFTTDYEAEILSTFVADVSNDPTVDYDSTSGNLDMTPCRPPDAVFKMNQEKTDVTCNGETLPVVTVDIVLPYAVEYLEGRFEMQSLGSIPAMDCTAMKAPIVTWDANQENQWVRVMPSTRVAVNDAACPLVQDTPASGIIQTVLECKTECIARPECNMIFVRLKTEPPDNSIKSDDLRKIEICTFHRCRSPENAPTPSTMSTEIWTRTSGNRAWVGDRFKPIMAFGGYVAFGTEDLVIHGGCTASDGLIPSTESVTVEFVPTDFPSDGMSVLRFQASQYNAEATVRISNVALNMFVNYTKFEAFYEVSASAPGGYYYADPSVTGSPRGPIAWTSSGVFVTSGDTSLIIIPN